MMSCSAARETLRGIAIFMKTIHMAKVPNFCLALIKLASKALVIQPLRRHECLSQAGMTFTGCPSQIIEVKELNWLDQDQKGSDIIDWEFRLWYSAFFDLSTAIANDVGTFTWSSGCLERLHQVEVIIAADGTLCILQSY